MIYEAIESSPLAKAKVVSYDDTVGTEARTKEKYPYSNLPIGYSFRLELTDVKNEVSLRVMASTKGKALRKKFAVIKHHDCYEIARVA